MEITKETSFKRYTYTNVELKQKILLQSQNPKRKQIHTIICSSVFKGTGEYVMLQNQKKPQSQHNTQHKNISIIILIHPYDHLSTSVTQLYDYKNVLFCNSTVPGKVVQIQTAILTFVKDFHLQEREDVLHKAQKEPSFVPGMVISPHHL